MERIFELSGLLVMPFWFLLVFLPRTRLTERLMRAPWAPALPAALYLVLVAPLIPVLLPALAQPKLGPIAALLGSPQGATIAWIHFLAFDLFVGRWIYLDARDRRLSSWIVSPLLVVTLMFGPIGLLSYLLLRAVSQRFTAPVPAAALGGQS